MKKPFLIIAALLCIAVFAVAYAIYSLIVWNRYVSDVEAENESLKEDEELRVRDYNLVYNEDAKVPEGVESKGEQA